MSIKSKLQFYDKKEGKSQTDLEDSLQEKNIEETFIQWQQELLFQFNVAIQVLSKHTSNITKTRSQGLDEYFSLQKILNTTNLLARADGIILQMAECLINH